MLDFIEQTLADFCSCFSNIRAFEWFVITIVGLMIRSDHLGVTSLIRELGLTPGCYESIIHFFHATSWTVKGVRERWYHVVSRKAPLFRINGRVILTGDGVKQLKEAFYMPGVKKMVQESEDCSKPEYIFGHMYGAVSVLIGNMAKKFCLPLKINIQDGLRAAKDWEGSSISGESHIIQMIESAFEAARVLGPSILLMDRYFLTVPALRKLKELNAAYGDTGNIILVTKAKANYTAYTKPEVPVSRKAGRPKKKGEPVKLFTLFDDDTAFKNADAIMYGKKETIQYRYIDLLWGPKLYQELRFVLVKYNGMKSIMVSTSLTIDPVRIVELYALRFNCEASFREFKQQFCGFGYHFWSKCLPRLNHFAKKGENDPLSKVTDEHERELVLKTVDAIEGFVLFSTIAMGITQMLSLKYSDSETIKKARYLRTYSPTGKVSEATIRYYLSKTIFSMLAKKPDSFITRFIWERQKAAVDTHTDGEIGA